ncbi:MAG: hypothetical protein HZC36_13700 [Armatimonadetes bacterium]|nr:hypothetical protein [Armatimonadota bacterium]
MRRSILASILPVAIGALAVGFGSSLQTPAPSPKIPGLTAPDKFPNGCVDCHIKLPNEDVRLNVALKTVKHHPSVAGLKTIPTDCGRCHRDGSPAGVLKTVLHKAHFQKKAESKFVTMFQGNCLACHALDAATGKVTVKSGPKNW